MHGHYKWLHLIFVLIIPAGSVQGGTVLWGKQQRHTQLCMSTPIPSLHLPLLQGSTLAADTVKLITIVPSLE